MDEDIFKLIHGYTKQVLEHCRDCRECYNVLSSALLIVIRHEEEQRRDRK